MLGYYVEDLEEVRIPERIKVIVCEPGKMARVAEIGTGLEDLQRAVGGGLIETYYPFEDATCIVCNDEGKYNGMRPCRAIYDSEKRIQDIVFGPFFICFQDSEGSWLSLDDTARDKLMALWGKPKRFERWPDGFHEFDLD